MFRFGFRRRRPARTYHVSSPDGNTLTFELEDRLTGQELLNRTLEECEAARDPDYFGLASYEGGFVKWIVVNKPLKKQLNGKGPFQLHLRVQVYPLDYHSLSQPSSRSLLCMQLRRDLLENRFSCEDDKVVWLLGLAVQADLGDYSGSEHEGDYLSSVSLMPRLTASLEQQILTQHQMNRGKPQSACREEFLGVAQLEAAYGIMSYQVQDSSRNPVTMTASPSGVRVLRGMMATNHYLWHTIIKISHRGRRLSLHISSQHLATGHTHFSCSSSAMAGNMEYHLSRLRENYTSTHTQRPSRLQRFFGSRRSMRVMKPLQRPQSTPSSNPLQRRSFAGEGIDPTQFNHSSPARPLWPSLVPSPNSTSNLPVEDRRSYHTHSDSIASRHSGVVETHSRQDSRISLQSPSVDPLSPDHPAHPRQSSIISQTSHRSSPSRHSQDMPLTNEPPVSPPVSMATNHYGNHNQKGTELAEWFPIPSKSPAHHNGHRGSPWQSGRNEGQGKWEEPAIIPEEGTQVSFPSRQRHHGLRATPPLHHLPHPLPQVVVEGGRSSTFPREGSLSQPEGNTESVVDLLDEALEVLDEEEDQRKEKERQRAMKPWKPQHRGRFRLSLQDSSYYDHRLYSSYRHFNRSRAFHGSKQSSSSTTHLNTTTDQSAEMVANAQLQESLVELSQASDTAIDPHIRSFVFEGSQTETGGATEL